MELPREFPQVLLFVIIKVILAHISIELTKARLETRRELR